MTKDPDGSDLKGDLGSRFLHRHFTMTVDSLSPSRVRARVTDQRLIDCLMVDNLITDHQHMAGNRLIEIAGRAGCYLSAQSFDPVVQLGRRDHTAKASRSAMLSRPCRALTRNLGIEGANVVFNIVVYDQPIRTEDRLDQTRQGLQVLYDLFFPLGYRRAPHKHFR